jgi:DNA-binding transcriptional ArsR family regulator
VGVEGEVRPVSGPTVGEVCCSVLGTEKISSSLSFHLKELRNAELITMDRRGKHMICGINYETLTGLAGYFDEPVKCCP